MLAATAEMVACQGCGRRMKSIERHLWWSESCRRAYGSTKCSRSTNASAKEMGQEMDDDGVVDRRTPRMNAHAFFEEERRLKVLQCLNNWTTVAKIGDKWRQRIKLDVEGCIELGLREFERDLGPHVSVAEAQQLMQQLRYRLNLFDGLSTSKLEMTAVKLMMPYCRVWENKVGQNRDDVSYNVIIADWLQLKLNNDRR